MRIRLPPEELLERLLRFRRPLQLQLELIKLLLDWPKLVQGAADALEPHRVANYLLETARLVHTWYHKHHVLGEPDDIMHARLVLAKSARIVIANALAVLGISAPERM